MKTNWKRNILIYAIILLAIIAIFSFSLPLTPQPEELPLNKVVAMSQEGQIAKMTVSEDVLEITATDGTEYTAQKEIAASVYEIEGLKLDGITLYINSSSGINWGMLLLNFLPLIIFGGLLFFLFRRAQGANSQAMSFGRSRARLFPPKTPTVTFEDVAGVDEAKQDLREVVDFLKSRDKFQELGARIPKGVLLIGPPGTGKTLMARAVAGEAGVPFFSISGSEFVEMFVGVGASRVRDLFDQAKKSAPCIIFIDEIDAVGRHRGAGIGGGHDEREQTLNQILVEMDGFDTNTSVIILAATNRPDILDPALLRPGRFDRRVLLDLPDMTGRLAILKVHTKNKPLAPGLDLEVLAKQTPGFSGADLSNLVNEAAILAARRGKKIVEMPELEESIDRVMAGPERKSRRISTREKEVIAYHESGHALVAHMLPNCDPPRKVTIIPRGMALGYTKMLAEEKYIKTASMYNDVIAMSLGGRIAEELIFNESSSGAASDIKRTTELARRMVTEFGMSDKLGPRSYGDKQEMVFLGREIAEQKDYGDKVANLIDDEVNRIIKENYNRALKILTENKEQLIKLAQTLISRETLEAETLEAILDNREPPPAPVNSGPPTPEPVPVEPLPQGEPVRGKGAILPKPVPKQAPAA
jgi:cell division protease FtsH